MHLLKQILCDFETERLKWRREKKQRIKKIIKIKIYTNKKNTKILKKNNMKPKAGSKKRLIKTKNLAPGNAPQGKKGRKNSNVTTEVGSRYSQKLDTWQMRPSRSVE